MRLVEGNHVPGNRLTGDDKATPLYCPCCGRVPELWYWTTVDSATVYPSLVCYGSKAAWLVRLSRLLGDPTAPTGAHYQYKLPSRPTSAQPVHFDRMTGRAL